ncbi:IS5 family transposase [Hansschlegelia zhihuaiae]|uniref:IS5 family transposase n=1 Tax=Hansschlegelia zhihuaiae TaxID=405005 RepID=UPI001FDF8E8E|nr:IS5 family transposase [Hansschlegelia zhihuaiae]
MARRLYWLSDDEWSRIEPLLPKGRRGARRVDDQRVISGIVHMLRSGARWRDCPTEYGPYTTVYNRFNRWSRQGVWLGLFEALTGHSGVWGTVAIDATHVKAHRSAAGAKGGPSQAVGASRGGRTTKLHALTDLAGRPRVLLLSPGNVNDVSMAAALIAAAGPFDRLLADRGYDANAVRALIDARGAQAVIPSTTSRRAPIPHDRAAYRARNLVERLWCRLKDFRRVATRYDKLARNFLSGAIIAATVTYWCN